MGNYLNPGNVNFADIVTSNYVDKTELISLTNSLIGSRDRLTCISRPRRFGKSYAAKMLCAYYDKSCDSHPIFDRLKIANNASYEKHINKYNVIYLDIAEIAGEAGIEQIVPCIKKSVLKEISEAYPEIKIDEAAFISSLLRVVNNSEVRFIAIIDEWDYLMRQTDIKPEIEKEYMNFLRALFKGHNTNAIFAGVYMTGILPIKKDGSQSALSDFQEYTMLDPDIFASSIGFTEDEVMKLCKENAFDFSIMKKWYDGYHLKEDLSIYNPNSVMMALKKRKAKSYWKRSEKSNALLEYLNRNYNGLSDAVARLTSGMTVRVNVDAFDNDVNSAINKDAVLTMLTHFGYLTYDEDTETVRIPNEEIQLEFDSSIHLITNDETLRRIDESRRLLQDTIAMKEEAVASAIEKVHRNEVSWMHYNNEQALRSVIKLAYYTYRDYYIQFEEFRSIKGIADILFLPRRDVEASMPALMFELKWNESATGAIDQILKNDYPEILKGYGGEIILIGINYDKDKSRADRKHTCLMRKIRI